MWLQDATINLLNQITVLQQWRSNLMKDAREDSRRMLHQLMQSVVRSGRDVSDQVFQEIQHAMEQLSFLQVNAPVPPSPLKTPNSKSLNFKFCEGWGE